MIRRTTVASVTSSVGVKVGVLCLAAAFVAVTVYGYMATPIDSPMDLLRGPIAALREDIPSKRWVAVIVSDLIMGFCLTALYVLWNYDRVAALVGSTSGVRNTGHDGMSGRLGDTDATPRST